MKLFFTVTTKKGRKPFSVDFAKLEDAQAFALLHLATGEWIKIGPTMKPDAFPASSAPEVSS